MSVFSHGSTLLIIAGLGLAVSWPALAQRSRDEPRTRDVRARDASSRELGRQAARVERTIDISELSRDRVVLVKDGKKAAIKSARPTLTRDKGDFLIQRVPIERPAVEAIRPDEPLTIKLPYKIITLDQKGERLDLRVIAYLHGGGLRARGGTAGFQGKLSVGVQDEAENHGPRSFKAIEMLITGDVDTVSPERVTLTRTNDLRPIELQALHPRDPVSVTIIPMAISSANVASKNETIVVPIVWAELSVTVSPVTIQGFGLETAEVTVRSHGLRQPEGVEVALATDRGSLEATTLVLNDQGSAATTIRSVSSGVARIEARGTTAQQPAHAELTFAVPWFFVFFAVAGGMVGAILRWGKQRRDQATGRPLWIKLILGALAGILISAAWAIGINLLAVEFDATAGEAVIFVLSALGAYIGLPGRKAVPGHDG